MPIEPLPDRWTTRDLPVLMATARLLDQGMRRVDAQLAAAYVEHVTAPEAAAAFDALADVYLVGNQTPRTLGGTGGDWIMTGLTERGRRAVGLWPSGESADALVDALRQAEDATDDPEEKTLLRRAAGAVGSVSRDVMVDVMGAVIARQSGMG